VSPPANCETIAPCATIFFEVADVDDETDKDVGAAAAASTSSCSGSIVDLRRVEDEEKVVVDFPAVADVNGALRVGETHAEAIGSRDGADVPAAIAVVVATIFRIFMVSVPRSDVSFRSFVSDAGSDGRMQQ